MKKTASKGFSVFPLPSGTNKWGGGGGGRGDGNQCVPTNMDAGVCWCHFIGGPRQTRTNDSQCALGGLGRRMVYKPHHDRGRVGLWKGPTSGRGQAHQQANVHRAAAQKRGHGDSICEGRSSRLIQEKPVEVQWKLQSRLALNIQNLLLKDWQSGYPYVC